MKNQEKTIKNFLKNTFLKNKISNAVIAVSGGIDSAVSLTLISQSLSPKQIYPLLLPYDDQNMDDAHMICKWNNIPEENIVTINIKETVDTTCSSLGISDKDIVRRGNVMARVRMIVVFDAAKKRNGLVVGTENKSEHYLGYYTRFGDEASDVEPLVGLYKTEVRELAKQLFLPPEFLKKSPSAGLWEGQTDENELGFTYEEADVVLREIVDNDKDPEQLSLDNSLNVSPRIVKKIVNSFKQQSFKRLVPYKP